MTDPCITYPPEMLPTPDDGETGEVFVSLAVHQAALDELSAAKATILTQEHDIANNLDQLTAAKVRFDQDARQIDEAWVEIKRLRGELAAEKELVKKGIVAVEAMITELAASRAKYNEAVQEINRLMIECGELGLDKERTETWTDEKGTVWSPPTAYGYGKACNALHTVRAELTAAKAEIERLEFLLDGKP